MAQSKLELAVDTGKWDAGLRKGQQALNAFIDAQGGLASALDKDNQKIGQFVQMMGKMDSTASTSKGQMNDYKRVIEQLTFQYNQMSDAQKKLVGNDFLQAIDQMKQKFQGAKQQVEDLNRSLGKMGDVEMPEMKGGDGDGIKGMLQVFGGNMMTKAVGALSNLGSEALSVAQQSTQMAIAAEGVSMAFERLDDGTLLDNLRAATHGTVNDLELMKAAVKFNDFKLPLDQLGTMLAFAQQKAKETGQSVDYMVDSIVTGLGRKSLMILDNLGFSASEIRERMKETGDMTKAVGEIIREQMQKAGDYVETASDRMAQAKAEMENSMLELGEAIERTFQVTGGVEGFELFLRQDMARTLTDVVNWIGDIRTAIEEVGTSTGFEAMCDVLDSLVIPKLMGVTDRLRSIKAFIDGLTGSGGGGGYLSGLGQGMAGTMRGITSQTGSGKGSSNSFSITTDSDGKVVKAERNGKDVTEEYLKTIADNTKPTKPTGTTPRTPKGSAWSPIAMNDMSGIDISTLGRSRADVKTDLSAAQKEYENAGDVFGRIAAKILIEQLKSELDTMESQEDPFADANNYDFQKDIDRLEKEQNGEEDKDREKEDKKEVSLAKEIGNMAGGMDQVVGGLEQLGVDIPDGLKDVVQGIQVVTTILTGIASIATAIAAIATADALIPFARGGIVGKAAGGMMIPGNSFSGDNLRLPVAGGGMIGVNAGELILNRSQQGVLASELQNAGSNMIIEAVVYGEDLRFVLNNSSRRRGRGEYVTSKNIRI